MSRTNLNHPSLQSLSPRQQVAVMRAARRRRTRRRVIHTLGVVMMLAMALGSWHLMSNYRIVHDPLTGDTRVMTIKQFDLMRGETKASHHATAKASASVQPRANAGREPVDTTGPMVTQHATDTASTSVAPTIAPIQPMPTAQEANSLNEDPEGYVTSFFGIVVKNKDFLPRKGG